MGFFSDLKDDLSQAVNEMMPEEGTETDSASAESLPDVDLGAMLDQMDGDMGGYSDISSEKGDSAATSEPDPVSVDQVAAQVSEPVSAKPDPVVIPEPAVKPEPPASQTAAVHEYLSKGSNAPADKQQVLDETAVITQGMNIQGDVSTQGSLDLVGAIVGNVSALGKLSITGMIRGNSKAAEIYAEGAQINGDVSSEGAVKVGQSTVIIGNITATSAVIAGAVKGDIDVRGPVILDGTAIVMGDIKSKYVQINNGAVIEGMCSQCYADVNPTTFFEELKKAF